jgi:hypothetical protein
MLVQSEEESQQHQWAKLPCRNAENIAMQTDIAVPRSAPRRAKKGERHMAPALEHA